MTFELIDPFVHPGEWWLELPPSLLTTPEPPYAGSTPAQRWNAYLNQVCLTQILPWIQTEYAPDAASWLNDEEQSAVWEVVNGIALVLGSTRLVLLPSEVMDDAELEVPQEWVDIPSWIADYYFAVQVQLEPPRCPWLRIWSYTTHQALKTQADYDPEERTYRLSRAHLNRDLSTFQAMLRFCSPDQTRAAIAPLPPLADAQAGNLIQRLGNPAVTFPRLSIPFSLWGAFLEQPAWRQQLYQQRIQPDTARTRTPTQLRQWLQNQLTVQLPGGWQSLQSFLGAGAEQVAFSLRAPEAETTQARLVELIGPSQSQSVLLVVKLQVEADGRVSVVAQVYPSPGQPYVPSGLTLSLLSDLGEVLQAVEAGAEDDYIQLRRFKCPMEMQFSLQILWQALSITEDFMV